MHYYKRHLGDYAKDTRHLTMLQHGAFTLLLDWYYSSERPLPIDRCDRIANAGTPAEREAVQFVLRDFFVETPEGWISRRADKEIAAMQEKSGKAANAAKARWDNNDPMRTHSERIANAMQTQCEGNASHKPLSTIQEPIEQDQKQQHAQASPALDIGIDKPPKPAREKPKAPPEWLDASAWDDWCAFRKRMKAPWTAHAQSLSIRKLDALRSAGHQPRAVIDQSIERGWSGLFEVKGDAPNRPAQIGGSRVAGRPLV